MAVIPSNVNISKLTKSAAGVLNAIRTDIGGEYYAGVPEAEDTTASIRAVGTAILAQQSRRNAFVSTLVNRIGYEAIKVKQYQNPWAMFKKGFLELGETVEEIFVNLCEVRGYDPSKGATRLLAATKPSVSVAFHPLNVQLEYPVTIRNAQLRQAFVSVGSLTKFVDGIISNMYTSMNYDEFLLMKYEIATLALNGDLPKVEIATPAAATSNAIATQIKEISNDMTFMSDAFTMSGNLNYVEKPEQYVIEQSGLNAVLDVNTLALAFNLDKAEFAGHVVLMDDLGKIDNKRLAKILDRDPDFVAFNATQLGYLSKIRGIVCAKEFFQIYDVFQEMDDFHNGSSLDYNYFLHKWQTVSASPFECVCLLTDQTSGVTSVTPSVNPSTITAAGEYYADVTVVTTGFASKRVTWSVAAGTGTEGDVSIDEFGVIRVKTGYTAGTHVITATSVEDPSVTGSATITLA